MLTVKRFGFVDVDRWHALLSSGEIAERSRVFCDGEDITHSCVWFDDDRGEAKVFIGQAPWRMTETGEVASEIKHGTIEVIAC